MKFPVLVLLAAGAFSAPFNIDEFNRWIPSFLEDDCVDPRLNQDVTSIFSYEGETLSTVQGSTADSTGLKLRAKILIHPQGACRYRMQINNPELLVKSKNQKHFQTAKESRRFSRELEAQDLIFQSSKGRITKLFPAVGESTNALNIKRGILSTLQLQRDATEEVDVNGRCKVNVFEKEGFLYKAKTLSDCSNRAHNELGIQTATFAHSKTPIKPLNSTSTCAYKMDGEKIMSIECQEAHIFRPFSAGYQKPAGAITSVKQILKLVGEKRGGRVDVAVDKKGSEMKAVSLIYEHETETVKPDNSILERIDNVMSALVDTSRKNNYAAKQSSAHEFTHLVSLMRKLDTKRMTPVMEKYFDCYRSGICRSSDSDIKGVYRQYILDSLTYCATPTCIHAVHDVIISGEISGEYMNMFLQGISIVAKPTKQMIKDLLNIARNKPSRQGFLSLGSMIQRYCKLNPEGCATGKWNPITQAEYFLKDRLVGCDNHDDYEKIEEVLMAMKAIGNAGQPVSAVDQLLRCARESVHMNVTTSALEALRHMPCSDTVNNVLHDLHEDIAVDTEKRIQTYLALMRCPTQMTVQRLVKQMKVEKSNQVGSFILSHLKNIKESSDPRHARTQEILSSIFNPEQFKKFDLPLTRFSKAFESSIYSKYMKSGLSVDGHVIYHPDNILPKSALFNMTANILDVPVNMIEMAARVEGVETLAEGLFGPYGYIPDDSIMKIFNFTFTKEDFQNIRARRSVEVGVDENVQQLHKKVNKKTERPAGFLSMKMFGHEMKVFSYDDIMWAADEIDNMNVIELLLKVAKGGHKTFTKSMMFLELVHTVPTGLGLPMRLKLSGSAVGSVELDGKFDIRNMFWGPSSMEVKGYIRPSAVVEVSGQMGVESHFVDTGIFVNTSMFTSQMMKGSVVYKEGQQLKINIDAPEEPIEFFNISSTPYMFVNEEVSLIEGAPRRIAPDFCLNSTMVLGMGVCTSMAVPVAFRDYEAPYFPFSGPAHFGMRLIKADPKLTTYQFLVSVNKKQLSSGHEYSGSFEIGTPGATYSRRLSGVVKYAETRKLRTLTIGSLAENNNVELKASYQNDTNRFEVDFITNVITTKPIKMKFLYFNETSFIAKETGILASVEYDWYKFQHVSKFVRKMESGSKLLHTKTTYWPKKHVTGEIEYMPKTKSLAVRLDANQFNQRLVMDGRFVSTDTEKGLNFTATSTMAKSSIYVGIVNSATEKKFVMNTTLMRGLRNEIVLGYYSSVKQHKVRLDVAVAGRTAALFVDYSNLRAGWHGLSMGASVQKNVLGVTTNYNFESKFDQQACVTAFYNDKRPFKTCLALAEVPSTSATAAFKRLEWSVEILKKTANLIFDVKNTDKVYGLTSTMMYEEKELMKNVMELKYDSMLDNEFKIITTVGQKSISTRWFSVMRSEDFIEFGVEANGFNQMVKLQGTYSKSTRGDASIYGVVYEVWMNEKLPVSYTSLLEYSDKLMGFTDILKIKEYQVKSSLLWIRPESSEYSLVTDISITKQDLVVFASKMTDILVLRDVEKAYKFLWEMTIWNKKFRYGYDIGYENESTESMSSYAVTVGVDYARGRRSSVKTTYSNSKDIVEVNMDVNYLPGRKVSHFARYTKDAKKLDISVEFLPKMYVKLMGRLDQTQGWKFTTDMKFTWANYERSLKWIASYVKTADIKGLNFKFTAFDRKFSIGSEYNSKTKTAMLTITAFKRSLRLTTFYVEKRGLAGVKLITEKLEGNMIVPTEIVEAVMQFSKTLLAFQLRTSKKSYMKTIATFDKSAGSASLELFVLTKNLFKIQADYKKDLKRVTSRMSVLGKERFQVVGKYNEAEKMIVLSFDALKKNWNIVFSGKWIADRKELTVSTEFMKRVAGFTARFDPFNYAASAHVFYQKNIAGWTVLYDPKTSSVVYNVTLTPRLSAQLVLQVIQDRVISITLQRKIGTEIVNEFVFRYELASATSSFVFEWNKDTTRKVSELVMPVLKNGVKDVTALLKKIVDLTKDFSTDAVVKGTARVLRMINNADKMFDEFDFVAARDRMGQMVVSVMKRSGTMTSKALKMASNALLKVHEKMPYVLEQAQKYGKEGLAIASSALDGSYKIAKVTYKVAKNITESGIPVARTALKLAKEFRIRGRTAEDIVSDLIKMINKLVTSYKTNLANQITKTRAEIEEFVKNTKVPYTEKNVGELYEEYMTKIKAIDMKKKLNEFTKKIMEFEFKGKTVQEYMDLLMKRVETLPEDLKKEVVSMIKMTRVNVKKMKKYLSKIESFFQPLTRCLLKIKKSVKTHFGPLVMKTNKMLTAAIKEEFNKMYLPTAKYIKTVVAYIKELILPIVKPFVTVYEDLKLQIRRIIVVDYEIGYLFDTYLRKSMTNAKETFTTAKTTLASYIAMVKLDRTLTAEETAEKVIDEAVLKGKKALNHLKRLYNERRDMYANIKSKYTANLKKVSEALKAYMSRPAIEKMAREAFRIKMVSVRELALVLDQVAEIDVSTPLSKAWRDVDILNHLEMYGVNSKILYAISTAKKVNVTEALFKAIKDLKIATKDLYMTLVQRVKKVYAAVDNVYTYIRSIPKKEFEVFFQEVESVVLKSQEKLYNFIKNVIYTTKEKLTMTRADLVKAYERYVVAYWKPLKNSYTLVKERSMLVYADVKDECMYVKDLYTALVSGMINERYEMLQKAMKEKYDELYNKALSFYKKYEHQTWEQITSEVYEATQAKYNKVYTVANQRIEKLRQVTVKAVALLRKLYVKALTVMKENKARAMKIFNEKVKPEAMRVYQLTVKFVKTKGTEYYEKMVVVYKKLHAEVVRVYDLNKKLSLRQLYVKTATFVKKVTKDYITEVKATAKESYGKVYTKSMQLKQKFQKEVLPVLREEAESIINQTLRASVILANETIKAFRPHYYIAMEYSTMYFKDGKKMAVKYYGDAMQVGKKLVGNARQTAMKLYNKALAKATLKYNELVKYVEKSVEKIKSHPKYLEIVNHEMYGKIKAFVEKMAKMIKQRYSELKVKVEELKNHPKIEEIKRKVKEFVKEPKMQEFIKILKQVRESARFTSLKLKAKIVPVLKDMEKALAEFPQIFVNKMMHCRQYPEECLWTFVAAVKKDLGRIDYDPKSVLNKMTQATKELYADVTDAATKKFVESAQKNVVVFYERAMELPKLMKQRLTSMYAESLIAMKERWAQLVKQWRNSPVYPIISHEIWTEIADEIRGHEIVAELKMLVKKVSKKVAAYNAELVEKVKEFLRNRKAMLKAEVDRVVEKYNKFLDETTLEIIVEKSSEVYTKVIAKGEKLMEKVKEMFSKAKQEFVAYKLKAEKLYKEKMMMAKKMWSEKYPKIMNKMKALYKEYIVKFDAAMNKMKVYYYDVKAKSLAKAKKMWDESLLKKKITILKEMTVGETVAALKKLPADVKIMLKDASKMILSKYDTLVKPYTQRVITITKFIGNEINETVVFVYRYYRLKENAKNVYNRVYKQIKAWVPKVPVFTKGYLTRAAKASVKGIHATAVFLDTLEVKPFITRMKALVPDFKRFGGIQGEEGRVRVYVNHPREIEPRFSYHVGNLKSKVQTIANKITTKTMSVTKALLDDLKLRTMELRRDLNMSILAHTKLAGHLKSRSTALKKNGMKYSTELRKVVQTIVNDWVSFVKDIAREAKKFSVNVYVFSADAARDIADSASVKEAYEKFQMYVEQSKVKFSVAYRLARNTPKMVAKIVKESYEDVVKATKPYVTMLQSAAQKWRQGAAFRVAFREVEVLLRAVYESARKEMSGYYTRTRNTIRNALGSEDVKIVEEYLATHRGILGKYAKKLFRMYKWNKINLDKAIRRAKMLLLYRVFYAPKKMNPLRTYAMIFGKNHVVTFDGKHYDFVKYAKPECTYLLGRDFRNGNFTLLSQKNAIIAKTPEMTIKIDARGHVSGSVTEVISGVRRTRVVKDLPVETEAGYCKTWKQKIYCNFKAGVTLRCDTRHFLCSVELSGWHYGKSEGLLGTNNNERFDEFRLPNNKLATSVTELANSWLVSKDAACRTWQFGNEAPTCNKSPSDRCQEVFKTSDSPFAKFFDVLDTRPFFQACQVDSADCEIKVDAKTSHCNATEAYRHMLRLKGIRAPKITDCEPKTVTSGKEVKHGDKWIQKSTKEVDIVVIVSGRSKAIKFRRSIAKMLYTTNKNLMKMGFSTRYALVSYGTDSKSYYGSDSHTFDGKYFSTMEDVSTSIKTMEYTGNEMHSNDYFSAIHRASKLAFRPGATKLFYLFNFDSYKSALFGPTLDHAKFTLKNDANATLFVFNDFNFKPVENNDILGMTAERVYLKPFRPIRKVTDFPMNDFTRFVKRHGGMFLNNLKTAQAKALTAGLSDAATEPLAFNMKTCQVCTVVKHKVMCHTDVTVSC